MAQFPGNFRALDVDQFTALTKKLDKIGVELESLNKTMSRLVDILDEITLAGEETDGPAQQGGPAAPTDHTG